MNKNTEQISMTESVFDELDSSDDRIIYIKPSLAEQEEIFKKDIILNGNFFKQSKTKVDLLKTHQYFLCMDCLYWKKENENQIYKVIYFKINLRMEFFCKSLNNTILQNSIFPYGLQLTKKQKQIQLFTHNERQFQLWRMQLGAKLLQHSFHNEFNVIKMIGKGSFAKVYLAKRKETQQTFAIKAFSKQCICKTKNGLKSLVNEILILQQIYHQNIIKLYNVYETVHSIYLCLNLISGGDLNEKVFLFIFQILKKIMKKQFNSYQKIQSFMLKLTSTIKYLHSKNIMHRDLKLDNILISSSQEFEPIIADFGLSEFDNQIPNDILFKRCGTPGFVAPEIINYQENDNRMYTKKCDIFSLGVIFYCLLSRKKPFAAQQLKELIKLNKKCKIDFDIHEIACSPESAKTLLYSMLEADPSKRVSAEECLQSQFFQESFKNTSNMPLNQDIESFKQQKLQLDAIFANKIKKSQRVDKIEIQQDIKQNKDVSEQLQFLKLDQENYKIANLKEQQQQQQQLSEIKDSQDFIMKRQEVVMNGKLDTVESMIQDISPNMRLVKQMNSEFSPKIINLQSQFCNDNNQTEEKKIQWGTQSTDLYKQNAQPQKEKNFLFDLVEVKSNELFDQDNN